MSATPGPWKLHGELGEIVDDSGERLIARVSQLYPAGKANARLIASAPDLLAEGDSLYSLLSQVYKDMSRLTTYGEWHHRTALALERWEATHVKATGEAIS